MATHSSILAWRIPWTVGCKESDTTEATKQQQCTALWNFFFFNFCMLWVKFYSKIPSQVVLVWPSISVFSSCDSKKGTS